MSELSRLRAKLGIDALALLPYEGGVSQVITELGENDYIEVFVENATSVSDITVSELSVIVEALN